MNASNRSYTSAAPNNDTNTKEVATKISPSNLYPVCSPKDGMSQPPTNLGTAAPPYSKKYPLLQLQTTTQTLRKSLPKSPHQNPTLFVHPRMA